MQSVRGTKDYFGPDIQKFDFIVEVAKKIFAKYGYSRIMTPIIENTELFHRIGESSDIVSKEMYTFEDKGGRSITLIPEGTAPVARAVIQHALELPIKLYYISPMFRYERPQHGRYRQLHQIGLEFIGTNSYFSDSELILVASEFLNFLNVEHKISLNYIGSLETRKEYLLSLKEFVVSNLKSLCEDCNKRFEKNILRVLDCKEKDCQIILEKAPSILDYLSLEEESEFKNIQEILKLNNINFNINSRIVRGLDYYTNLVFEVHGNDGLAILGGGRYNNLYKEMGRDSPAVGLGIGIERLINLISFYPKESTKLYIAVMDKSLNRAAFILADSIRKEGFSVLIDYDEVKFKKQLSRASKLGVEYLIVFGENELKNVFNLKNMQTGEVKNLNYKELIEFLKGEKNV